VAAVSTTATPEDHTLARQLATDAGKLLVELRGDMVAQGAEPAAIKDAGDLAAHRFIVETLATARPGDAVLSEEESDPDEPEKLRQRREAQRTWIIDPLDGTREFGEPPRVDWAVHIALVIDGQPVAGAVALPAEGVTLATDSPPPLGPGGETPRVIVSRTRRPEPALRLAEELGAEYIELGSAGAKTMAVVRGQADIYPHAGGQYEWDSCAPVAVARSAGLHCSRLDGSPLSYNNTDPYLPDLLVCRPEWAERCLSILSR
jgi:3'(2'), 5'-bisphosphate nucleotidase